MTAGGKERRLTELMKAFKLYPEIQFELVVMDTDIHYKEVLELSKNIHFLIRKTKHDPSIFRKFFKICKNFKPDIINCWDSMTAFYAIPTCKLLNIRLINSMVVDTPVRTKIFNKYKLLARLVIPFSDIVIGNSLAGLNAYGVSEKKSACIYNGLDLSRFENIKDPSGIRKDILGDGADNFFVIGMVAAFEERKDYETLIKSAIILLEKYDIMRFILIGDGIHFDKIKSMIPALLSDKIVFLGRRSDIESLVNTFDIGVLLTNTNVHGEGISNSILEYMALGNPVIATRGGGTNEVVIDNFNGLLIDAFNMNQLVKNIELLFFDKALKERLSENGIKLVREKFDISDKVSNYLLIYKKLINRKINS